jgi:hypothetical protein
VEPASRDPLAQASWPRRVLRKRGTGSPVGALRTRKGTKGPGRDGFSSRPRPPASDGVLEQIGFGVIPPGTPGGGWGAAEAATDSPEPCSSTGNASREATPPGRPARGQPRCRQRGVQPIRGRARESFSIAEAGERASARPAEGTPGRTVGLLDGRTATAILALGISVQTSRKAPKLRVSGTTGGVRGSLTHPRGGPTRRPEERRSRLREEAVGTGSARPWSSRHRALSGASRAVPKDARARAVREASRSGSSAVKRVSLLRGDAEEVERFESGARGVGRLMHTSGRRILSAGTGERREAFAGQAGQLRGELPPEDAGEKGLRRHKGARAASRELNKGTSATPSGRKTWTASRRETLWVRDHRSP